MSLCLICEQCFCCCCCCFYFSHSTCSIQYSYLCFRFEGRVRYLYSSFVFFFSYFFFSVFFWQPGIGCIGIGWIGMLYPSYTLLPMWLSYWHAHIMSDFFLIFVKQRSQSVVGWMECTPWSLCIWMFGTQVAAVFHEN